MLGLISKKKTAMEQGYQSYEVLKNYVSEKMKEEILIESKVKAAIY